MKKIILDCTNLLGDSLYLLRPVQAYLQKFPDTVSVIVADRGLAFEMFYYQFEQDELHVVDDIAKAVIIAPEDMILRVSAGDAGKLSFNNMQLNQGHALHISDAYSMILGADMGGNAKPLTDWQQAHVRLPRTFFAISPFSKSCSRHSGEKPNKTLDDHKWEYIIRYLRRQGMPVKVIAGPNDVMHNVSVPLDAYFTAKNLLELETFLKQCALLITVDNGLGHVASILNTPMIYLWPGVSNLDFIYPRFGTKTTCVEIGDPNLADPARILTGIRMFAKMILGGKDETTLKE